MKILTYETNVDMQGFEERARKGSQKGTSQSLNHRCFFAIFVFAAIKPLAMSFFSDMQQLIGVTRMPL